MIKHYTDLRIYQLSYRLALEIHKMTQKFPDFEKYELG
ncbi:four helix bundle protein [Tepidibacillus infernus]